MARAPHCLPLAVTSLTLLLAAPAWPETRYEVEPEVDVFFKLNGNLRLFLLGNLVYAPADWNGGAATDTELEVGPHLDVSLKPVARQKLRKANWERERYLWFRVGYTYSTSLGDVEDPFHENRGILEVTGRAPLPGDVWIESRERVDLRDKNGTFSTRFRWRTTLERETSMFGAVTMPYFRFEIFYDGSKHAWSRQTYQAGMELIFDKRWRLEPYYLYQEDERSQPAHTNAFGLILKHYR